MIIAGPCSYIDKTDEQFIFDTAEQLKNVIDYFRCKIYLGGTRPEIYFKGIRDDGFRVINKIDKCLIPAGIEVQTETHIHDCYPYVSYIWIGARNSQNYGLLESLSFWDKPIFLKRGSGMTIDEVVGLFDIMRDIHKKNVWIIERGINTFDRLSDSRWSPDLKGVIRIKNERKDIFEKLVVDCSHSVGRKEYIGDVYNAFKAIGCKNFMFEATASGRSKTDQRHMLSTDELKKILGK